jgi:hypothetical protein
MTSYGTDADRTLRMAHVMSAMRIRLEYNKPDKHDRSDGAQAWHSVYQVVCWAEASLLRLTDQGQRRAS